MADSNKDQDPIEDFFERNAWDYDIPFREADWLRLEKKLDIQDRQRAARRRRRWIAAAAVILLGLMGYFTYQNYSQINEINEMLQAQQEGNEQAVQPLQELPAEIPRDESGSEQNSDLAVTGSESSSPSDDESQTIDRPVTVDISEETPSENSQLQASTRGLTPQSRIYSLTVTELACADCEQVVPANQKGGGLKPNSRSISALDISKPGIASRGLISLAPSAKSSDTNPDIVSRLGVALLAGPDLSMAGSISDFYDPGYTIGFMAEYKFSKRLSIRGGLQRSEVRYTAGSNEYNPPAGYWTNGIVADQTTAECLILDIPLNLKYEMVRFSGSALYATGGVSSYIMLNETYRYDYNYSNNQSGLVQEWSEKTGTRHWFSNAMVSIGYEINLQQKWSLRAEPYLKLPISDVGWGNVDLYSTGSIISLNYQFGSK